MKCFTWIPVTQLIILIDLIHILHVYITWFLLSMQNSAEIIEKTKLTVKFCENFIFITEITRELVRPSYNEISHHGHNDAIFHFSVRLYWHCLFTLKPLLKSMLIYCEVVLQKLCPMPTQTLFNIGRLMQERHNSSALAMELCLSCSNPLICSFHQDAYQWVNLTKGNLISLPLCSVIFFLFCFCIEKICFWKSCYQDHSGDSSCWVSFRPSGFRFDRNWSVHQKVILLINAVRYNTILNTAIQWLS